MRGLKRFILSIWRSGWWVGVGLKYLKTTVVAIYGYLILIVATIASLILGQDRFSWTQTFAILFICVGVYLVEVAESKDKTVPK